MTGRIFDVKELAVHDGPGLRTTVFLKGCPLSCLWCHNPEGLHAAPELIYKRNLCTGCGACRRNCRHPECAPFGRCLFACPRGLLEVSGREVSDEVLAGELLAGAAPLGDAFGGFTFSGGEPLAQWEFLLALSDRLAPHHLALETSGYADEAVFRRVIARMDFVYMDVKLADSALHRRYTGRPNEGILGNLKILMKSGKPYTIRTPLVPGITDTEENLGAIRALIGDSPWEKLPYNAAAGAKYEMLGREFPMKSIKEQL